MVDKSKFMKPCAICNEVCSHLGARGREVVCDLCAERAVDSNNRPIVFRESLRNEEGVLYISGPNAYYRQPDPQAGEIAEEASKSLICYIDGIECRLYEGVAGWVGIVKKVDESWRKDLPWNKESDL